MIADRLRYPIGFALNALLSGCSPASVPEPASAPPMATTEARTPSPSLPPSPSDDSAARHEAPRASGDQLQAPAQPEPKPKPEPYPFQAPMPSRTELAKGPANHNANLSIAACRAELKKQKLPVRRDHGPAKGIGTPLRLTGPIEGVTFVSAPAPSPYGKLDCRLALTLVEFARVLRRYDVASVRVDNFYRPKAHLRRGKLSQHAYGLAIDLTQFTLSDGTVVKVEDDWQGALGEPVCGPDAKLEEPTDKALLLRNLACDLARSGLFHHILTPNYNQAHRNHWHLDIKRDNRWFAID